LFHWIRGREARLNPQSPPTTTLALSDRELVAAIGRHDEESLRVLYRRYGSSAYALVLRIVGDEECAEEVVQDVFLRIWRHAVNYNPEQSSLATWILGIARNLAVDELRRRRVRPIPYEPATSDDQEAGEPRDPDPLGDPQVVAELADVRGAIQSALGTLPGVQRAAIELAYFGGLSQSEIAQVTGLPLGTIKSRIRFGMHALQAALAARGYGPSHSGGTDD